MNRGELFAGENVRLKTVTLGLTLMTADSARRLVLRLLVARGLAPAKHTTVQGRYRFQRKLFFCQRLLLINSGSINFLVIFFSPLTVCPLIHGYLQTLFSLL